MMRYMTCEQLQDLLFFEGGFSEKWFISTLATGYCKAFRVLGGKSMYRTTYEGLAVIASITKRFMKSDSLVFQAASSDEELSALVAQSVLAAALKFPVRSVRESDALWAAALHAASIETGQATPQDMAEWASLPKQGIWGRAFGCHAKPQIIDVAHARSACERMVTGGYAVTIAERGAFAPASYGECAKQLEQALRRAMMQ